MLSLEQIVMWVQREDKNADPLEFFRKNHPVNETRTHLFGSDSALYRSLLRLQLLDEAIPNFDEKASRRASKNFKKARLDRSRFGYDSIKYYNDNYENFSKEEVGKIDSNLRERLKRDGLWDNIPTNMDLFGGNPEKCYINNYYGFTRPQLKIKNPILHNRLVRDETIDIVPEDFGDDLMSQYKTYYNGLTRVQLRKKNEVLHQRLQQLGLLNDIPGGPSAYGNDPLAFYYEHCSGMARGQLFVDRKGLYNRLWNDGLLKFIPKAKSRERTKQLFDNDPEGYYLKHHVGETRWELQQNNRPLYNKLWRDGKLDVVPTVIYWDGDALGYYKEHFEGIPRGELSTKHQALYWILRKEGTLKDVPTLQSLKTQAQQ